MLILTFSLFVFFINNEIVISNPIDIYDPDNLGTCDTPENLPGICLILNKCEKLRQLFEKIEPLTSEEVNFLQQSQCRYQTGNPYVCCPIATYRSQHLLPSGEDSNCGVQIEMRVKNGLRTNIDEFPWAVLLMYERKNFSCGGSIINERYIITAAHCVELTATQHYGPLKYIRVGEWDYSSEHDCVYPGRKIVCAPNPIDVPVENVIIHNKYKYVLHYDIALVRLVQPLQYNSFVKPICLPIKESLKDIDYKDSTLIVTGWGHTAQRASSPVKLKASVRGWNNEACLEAIGSDVTDKHLCAGGEDGIDSCSGDSGGPLMATDQTASVPIYYLAGIVSYGFDCGIDGVPGVYTRVSKYINWIYENIHE